MKNEVICGIYCIENLITNMCYVGQSIDIYQRWYDHKWELNNNKHCNIHLQRSWNKHKEQNFKFYILETCGRTELNDREIYWIKEKDSYCNGYNQTEGGQGPTGFTHTEESIEKMRKSQKERFSDIKNRETCSLGHLNESKPVYQIDFSGNIVKEWRSYGWAASMLGFSRRGIYDALNNINHKKTSNGFIWIYVDKYDPEIFDLDWYLKLQYNKVIVGKAFLQYDLDGNFIMEYASIRDVDKAGFNRNAVYRCAAGLRNKYKGFIWKEKTQERGV